MAILIDTPSVGDSESLALNGTETLELRFRKGATIQNISIVKGSDGTLDVNRSGPGGTAQSTVGDLALADTELKGHFVGPMKIAPGGRLHLVADSLTATATVGIDYDPY